MKSLTTFALVMVAHMLLLTAPISAATVLCSSPNGARFNLEPRANALPQGSGAVDLLPNRLGAGDDLIVEVLAARVPQRCLDALVQAAHDAPPSSRTCLWTRSSRSGSNRS